MNKIETKLDFYTYDSSEYTSGARLVTWWVLQKDNEGNEDGRTFTAEEERLFIQYTLNNTKNFPEGYKNVYLAKNEDAPSIDEYDFIEVEGIHPQILTLRNNPSDYTGQRYPVMDIKLFPKHTYNLPFDVIGQFNY